MEDSHVDLMMKIFAEADRREKRWLEKRRWIERELSLMWMVYTQVVGDVRPEPRFDHLKPCELWNVRRSWHRSLRRIKRANPERYLKCVDDFLSKFGDDQKVRSPVAHVLFAVSRQALHKAMRKQRAWRYEYDKELYYRVADLRQIMGQQFKRSHLALRRKSRSPASLRPQTSQPRPDRSVH